MEQKTILIVGLGLIGGSLAKALRRTNPHFRIYAADNSPDNLSMALKEGVIEQKADSDLAKIAPEADIIFLCTPINTIPDILRKISGAARPGAIISDVGSIKSSIMQAAEQILPKNAYFIGGHPMAGTERSGYSASMAHLFENAYYILTPQKETPPAVLEEFKNLISSTGALPLILDPLTHDQRVGAVSHLPHIIASALVNTVSDLDGSEHDIQKLAAGGFKDITRIASSNPAMWRDICLANRDQILPLLRLMIRNLYEFGQSLEKGDERQMEAFYEKARSYRNQIPSSKSLFLLPYYQIYVDVEDKPGIMGYVTGILGSHNVNIKNIRIINSRENEPGCLVLSLDDQAAQKKAVELLNRAGCRAYTDTED